MTLLAVCHEQPPNGAVSAEIIKCHTNLWRDSRRQAYLDVGLLIEVAANSAPLSNIEVYIRAPVDSLEGLFGKLCDAHTATIIFNEQCQVTPISQSEATLTLQTSHHAFRLTKASLSSSAVTEEVTRITVGLDAPVVHNTPRYVRFRMRLKGPHRTLTSHGVFSANRMFVQDFRFYEVRQRPLDGIPALRGIPIRRCQHFLIVPSKAVQTEHAPRMKLARLLESQEWAPYFHPQKVPTSTVYYWDSNENEVTTGGTSGKTVTDTNPYRIFSKFRPPARVTELVTIGFLVAIAWVVLGPVLHKFDGVAAWAGARIADAWGFVTSQTGTAIVGLLGLVGLGTIIRLGWKFGKKIRNRVRKVRA